MSLDPVRLVIVPEGGDSDSAAAHQIMLDLLLDTETGASNGPFPAFGRIGDFRRPETLYPFTLMMDGRVDLGAHANDAQRQHRLEVRDTQLREGTCIALDNGETRTPFVIQSVTRLAP
ncbi:MAG: hypothetical protein J0I80_03860 [Sphingomonas sp.]|nr:hypothetical protein [Sphingomonas sp.]